MKETEVGHAVKSTGDLRPDEILVAFIYTLLVRVGVHHQDEEASIKHHLTEGDRA